MSDPPRIDPDLRDELSELTTGMCKALNDSKRLCILYALRDGPLSVTELCEVLQAPQSNTSQHLAVLRERGLIEADRRGNNVYYGLRHPRVLEAIDLLRAIMADELDRRQGLLRSPS